LVFRGKCFKEGVERRREMRVRVEQDICVGDETCVEICPEVFDMDGDVAVTKMDEVPEELEEACRDAAESCPAEAIIIEE
jgi:ferredoxin